MVASRERNAGGRHGTSWLFGLGLVPNVSFGVHWGGSVAVRGPNVRATYRAGEGFVTAVGEN
jgi:hypothetical protein